MINFSTTLASLATGEVAYGGGKGVCMVEHTNHTFPRADGLPYYDSETKGAVQVRMMESLKSAVFHLAWSAVGWALQGMAVQ